MRLRTIPFPIRTRTHRVRRCILALATFVLLAAANSSANAVWKPWQINTPRDTFYVNAKNHEWTTSNQSVELGVRTIFYFSGTFGIFPWQDSAGFDARYLYSDNAWSNAPFPLANPPSWNGTSYQVYLQVDTNSSDPSSGSGIRINEAGYQADHEYTAIYGGTGDRYAFRIYDRISEDPSYSDYSIATGGVHIHMARFTAGVALEYASLSFPVTNVGERSTLLDSIESYGLDPLNVDSVWISGVRSSDFSFTSQSGNQFVLPTETTNAFAISFAPSIPDSTSIDTLYIRSKNADPAHRIIRIVLVGTGAAPSGAIGPNEIDFGLQRVGVPTSPQYVYIFNSGNAPFVIADTAFLPAGAFCTYSHVPDTIGAESKGIPGRGQFSFSFTPRAATSYSTIAQLKTNQGVTQILLTGQGAMPDFRMTDSSLNFGTLFTGNDTVLYDTVRNVGNWTAHVTLAQMGCQNPQFFSFSPPDQDFYLAAGASRIYAITFRPGTTTHATLRACLTFYFDDATAPKSIDLVGIEKQREIKYDDSVIDFGTVKIGNKGFDTLGVMNSSGYSATFTDALATNNPVLEFAASHRIDSGWFRAGRDSVPLVFQPVFHGPASAELYLHANGQDDSVRLIGFGAVTAPVFTPDSIYYQACKVTTQNYGSTVLSDTGDYPLYICNLQIVGPDAGEFSLYPLQHPLPDTVRAGGLDKRTFGVNFTTNVLTGQDHTATLIVEYCDGSSDSVHLRAKEADQYIQFCSQSIDFGTVRVGRTADSNACFWNNALIAFPDSSVWITPAGGVFSVAQDSLMVPANARAFDLVTFRPNHRGLFTGYLHSKGEYFKDDSIPVTGIGVQSVAALSYHWLDFGKVPLQVSSLGQALWLKDSGDFPLVANVQKINDPYQEFTVTLDTGTSVVPVDPTAQAKVGIGDSVVFSITFTPQRQALPDHESELVFTYDNGSSDTVHLVGRDRSDYLAFDRDTLDFGKVRLGTTPPSRTVRLLNTSDTTLLAKNVTAPNSPFSATITTPISVDSNGSSPIQVGFIPQSIGNFSSIMTGEGVPFKSGFGDTVVLTGTGAAPIPQLSVDTLDFGTIALGRSVARTFTLANNGNWPLAVTSAPVAGTNAADFTALLPADTTIADSEATTYTVTYRATTPRQLTPRTGMITWTMDDGSQFTLYLIARDVPPISVKLGFPHAYFGRPGDKVAAELDLQNFVPDTAKIDSIVGTITYDPSIVDLKQFGAADTSLKLQSIEQPGTLQFKLASDSLLTHPKPLLNFTFQFHLDLSDGASTPFISLDTLPDTKEAVVTDARTTIFLDSTCGTIHLISDAPPIANFVRQNSPNPFGIVSATTTVPFDVGTDNTMVTIRILDPTGREILRPVDAQAFQRGRYEVSIDANTLHPGVYFYEFRAGTDEPQMLKMVVE